MLKVRKSRFRGISAIFFQGCFKSESTSMNEFLLFLFFSSRNHFLHGDFTFQWGDFTFKWGVCPIGGISFDGWRDLKKTMGWGWGAPMPPPHLGNPGGWVTMGGEGDSFLPHVMTNSIVAF